MILDTLNAALGRRPDLFAHFAVGSLVGLAAVQVAALMAWPALPVWAVITVLVAAGKEVRDEVSHKGTPAFDDMGLTVLGGLVPLLATLPLPALR